MNLPCGCCEGTGVLTPLPTANRPGLNMLSYRVGAHAAFLETMKARLSSSDYPELASLRTRESADFSIALLDAWATLADVLTFYQERIANEGYLRTATERRSILELARLVGYKLRPGVASSVCLAYTLEKGSAAIPAGERAQSVPMPGEKLQSFETSERLLAGSDWNVIRPRMTKPTKIVQGAQKPDEINAYTIEKIYIQGTSTQLMLNDPLLFVFDEGPGQQVLRRVKEVKPQKAEGRTMVTLQPLSGLIAGNVTTSLSAASLENNGKDDTPLKNISKLIVPISKQPSLQLADSLRLTRDFTQIFDIKSDANLLLLAELRPQIKKDIYTALANYDVKRPAKVTIYALRLTASLFGANAPPRIDVSLEGKITPSTKDWPVIERANNILKFAHEKDDVIYLDASYNKISSNSWVLVDTSAVNKDIDTNRHTKLIDPPGILFAKANNPDASISRKDYCIAGKTTRIELVKPDNPLTSVTWIKTTNIEADETNDFQAIRQTVVYAQSEELKLAEEPIMDDIEKEKIELDTLYPGLDSGRWIIVSGERTIPNTSGVKASELVMLAGVEQSSDEDQSGDKGTTGVHSTFILDKGLAYTYKRETVTIYANVVKATHGEIKKEVLGSGDGSAAFQQFALSQAPLTHLSAATPAGAKSSLQVRVNGILWHEAESLLDLGPRDRGYITKTDDAGKTTVIFGNGEHGSRLPTGVENVTAVYRAGIGRPGNVNAGQIRLLATKPPGAKAVANPLRSSGGADREGPDQGRRNAPLATMALDRLVSVEDYAFFARTYAGIEKASAVGLSNGHRQLVHLTIAGSDDIPIDTTSDLLRNLNQALHQFGDPFQPVQIAVRELMLLIISANVRILPDYQWEKVEPQIRSALLDAFGFDRRELGQSAFLSEVVSVIQQVEGVDYVDMVVFDSVSENVKPEELGDLSSSLSLELAIKVQLARLIKELKYVFSWTDIQTNNTLNEFKEFLKQELGIGWADSVKKINNGSTNFINFSAIDHLLELSSEGTEVILKIDSIRTAKFIAKKEGQNRKIYKIDNRILPAQLAYLSPDMRETLILNPLELSV